MSIPYMQILKYYTDLSVGQMTATEQLLFFRLFLINNRCGWSAWFGATNQRLMLEMGINREKTLIQARNKLKSLGFIDFIPGKKGCPTKYTFTILNTSLKEVNREVKDKNTSLREVNREVKTTDIYKTKTKTKTETKKAAAAAAENPAENFSPATLAEDARKENDSLTLAEDKEPKDEFAATVKVFEENFHAVGKTEKQELHALFLRYGATWLTEAIKETALSGGRSVRYIKAILERWQKDGFKSKTKGGSMRGITVQSPSQDGIDDFGEAELRQRQNRPWDVQPKPESSKGV